MRNRRSIRDLSVALALSALIVIGGALGFSLVGSPQTASGKLQVMTSFYPLHFFASQIGGEKAQVGQLIPDNTEPHAWDPRPSDIIRTDRSSIFIYNGAGFEPWAESFISSLVTRHIIVDTSVGLVSPSGPSLTRMDPHFWLDPLSAEVQVDNILAGFFEADPANAAYYQANADRLKSRLDQLNVAFLDGLQNRTKNDIITTHEGFDYMANRYGFQAHAAVGIGGDQQPSPADLTALADLVRNLNLHYVFSEPIFSDAVMLTIASETGAQVLVLDGVHGRTGVHAGMDYFQIMYENLKNLRIGLEVSP